MANVKPRATKFDSELGARLRLYRKAKGISQVKLADYLGVSFQQVQKYEKGSNRISAEKFILLCDILDVSPDQFVHSNYENKELFDSLTSEETMELFYHWSRISSDDVRKEILNFVKALTQY